MNDNVCRYKSYNNDLNQSKRNGIVFQTSSSTKIVLQIYVYSELYEARTPIFDLLTLYLKYRVLSYLARSGFLCEILLLTFIHCTFMNRKRR